MRNFEVLCDNAKSYQICAILGQHKPVYGKPIVLVRCDRMDIADNERGLKLANLLCDFFNGIGPGDLRSYLTQDMIPGNHSATKAQWGT